MNTNVRWYVRQVLSLNITEIIKIPDLAFAAALPGNSDFTVTLLREEEVPELMEFHDSLCTGRNHVFSREEVRFRLKAGDLCSCARFGKRLVGFCWFKVGNIHSSDLHCLFEFGEKNISIYNGFVDPEYRGNSLLPLMMQESFRILAGMGYRQVYGYLRSTNRASKRALDKYNRITVGKIIHGYLLGFYFFIPVIPEDAGISVYLDVNPWHRWQAFFNKRLSRIGAQQ